MSKQASEQHRTSSPGSPQCGVENEERYTGRIALAWKKALAQSPASSFSCPSCDIHIDSEKLSSCEPTRPSAHRPSRQGKDKGRIPCSREGDLRARLAKLRLVRPDRILRLPALPPFQLLLEPLQTSEAQAQGMTVPERSYEKDRTKTLAE